MSSRKTSLFLEAQMHPVATFAAMAGLGLAAAWLLRPRPEDRHAMLQRRERAAGIMGSGQDWAAPDAAHPGAPRRRNEPRPSPSNV